MSRNKPRRGASQRQLKVGEVIRHALAEVFSREPLYEPELEGISITVSEVKVSPDLKNATAYVTSLGGQKEERQLMVGLHRIAPELRRVVTSKVQLRHSPQLAFRYDESFNQAARIDTLLRQGMAKPEPETTA